jgi:hypothetical protein
MREPDDRLAHLESYQALPLPLRRAVRLHLVHGLAVSEAMRLAGRDRNVKRDWNQPAVQAVLTEWGNNPDAADDWPNRVLELECWEMEQARAGPAIPIPPQIAPEQKAGSPAPSTDPRPPGQNQAFSGQTDPDRCQICGLILCSCPRPVVLGTDSSVDPADLFPGLNNPLGGPKGPSSLDFWRLQAQDEADERAALLKRISSREPRF